MNGISGAMDGMDASEMIKAMKVLGLDKGGMLQAMWDNGANPKDIEDFSKLIDSMADSSSLLSNLKDGFTGLGETLKAAGKGAMSFLANNWISIATAAVVATAAIVAYNNTFDKLCDNAANSQAALESTRTELESLQNQKESNSEKIKQLEESGTASSEEEISALERQNALIQAQINLKKELEKEQTAKAAEDAYKALSKTIETVQGDSEFVNGELVGGNVSKDIVDVTAEQVKQLDATEQAYLDISNRIQEITDKQDAGNKLTAEENSELQNLLKWSDIYKQKMSDLTSEINENKSTIFDLYDSLVDQTGKPISGFESMVNKILGYFPELTGESQSLSENMQTISDTFRSTLSGENMNAEDLEKAMEKTDSWLSDLTEDEQQIVFELFMDESNAINSFQDLQAAYAEYQKAMTGTSSAFPVDIDAERGGIDALNSAISESSAATGLAAATTQTLIDRYKDLDGFDA